MTASVTTLEMYAMDSSMGTLGTECLSGGLYCDMSLCYGHRGPVGDIVPPPQMRIYCQFTTMGCRTGLLPPATPAAPIPVLPVIYGTVECYLTHLFLYNCTPPTPKAVPPFHPNQIPKTALKYAPAGKLSSSGSSSGTRTDESEK